jgi:hypothetical protein
VVPLVAMGAGRSGLLAESQTNGITRLMAKVLLKGTKRAPQNKLQTRSKRWAAD